MVYAVILAWLYIVWKCLIPVLEGFIELVFLPYLFNALEEATLEPVKYSCEFASGKYYALCGLGGILSCGITHTALVPLDLVKCRMQVNPLKYKGIAAGFSVTVKEEGVRALAKGWAPTAIGYSLQGLGKFGFYEIFKVFYSNLLGDELSYTWRTSVYLAASASAEFFADILLAPMEASKVRIQTMPGAPPTLRGIAPMIWKNEGINGFYKGLPPLWMRQIPYTMMKFFGFERAVELIYKQLSKPKDQYNKLQQLGVSFAGGYLAGIFCAAVSHPADSVVSILNKNKNMTIGQVVKNTPTKDLLTKGLGARIVMIGTLTGLQWLIYDSFKTFVGLPTTGGVAKPVAAPATSQVAATVAKLETKTAAPTSAPKVEAPKAAAPAAPAAPKADAKPATQTSTTTVKKEETKKEEKKH